MFQDMKTSLRSLALAGLLCAYLPSTAQFFTPPAAYENVFPAGSTGALLRPETSSAYSISSVNEPLSGLPADLYLSGWSGQIGGGFAWQFTDVNDPTVVIQSGYIPYPNGRDVEVGLVDGAGWGRQILVAYHEAGVGHMLHVYDVIPGTGITFAYAVPLSGAANYSRISMDCHLTYGVAIVWENNTNGQLEMMGGSSGSWGPIIALPVHPSGAASWDPDVAFSHVGNLNVHVVSMAPGEITEAVLSWPDLMSGSLASYIVEDNNFIPPMSVKPVRPVIDCTDHYGVENWAYTYTLDNNRINVRYVDYNTTGTPTTVVVNDGPLPASWGITPTTWNYRNKMPSLAYGRNGNDMYVAWYVEAIFPGAGTNQYIALNITEDASTLVSSPEYMGIPNSVTTFPYPITPGISLSKMNDLNPEFLYAAYYDLTAGGYDMHNAYHKWPDPVFKGAAPVSAHQLYHPECGQQATASKLTPRADVKVSPNPFTNMISALVNATNSGTARMQLTDITGRIVAQQQVSIEKGIQTVRTGDLNNLATGTYILNVFMDDVLIGHQKLVKQ
jgi:hypothetical protein